MTNMAITVLNQDEVLLKGIIALMFSDSIIRDVVMNSVKGQYVHQTRGNLNLQ